MKHGELEINLYDDSFSECNESLSVTKQLYVEDSDLVNPKVAINLMVSFLRALTYSDDTILCVLADEINDMVQNAEFVAERNDRYEVCKE